MPHVFKSWNHIADRLRSAPLIALFLDFDGTLAPLRPLPDEVSVDRAARQSLAALAQSRHFRRVGHQRPAARRRAQPGLPPARPLPRPPWMGRAQRSFLA